MLKDQRIAAEWSIKQKELGELYNLMIRKGSITLNDKTLRFQHHMIGQKPANGYSLVFGLHGGGGCPTPVNDQQYQNHLCLYDKVMPQGVIWVALRSCEQASDMWWKPYLPEFFAIIIRGFVLQKVVNPNKIFLTGYSAGGDGVYHMGPMLADWFAASAMMAGHPNNTQLYNLRNCPFSIQVGGKDAAYNRNNLAREYINKMNELHNKYGKFQTSYCHVFEDCEHWMNLKDAQMLGGFLRQTRNPYPKFILFKQHPRYGKKYFYNLQVQADKHKQLLVVLQRGNQFHIESEVMPVKIYFNHLSVDFMRPVVIIHNKIKTAEKMPQRNDGIISMTIEERIDPCYIFEDCLISNPTSGRVPLEYTLEELSQPEKYPFQQFQQQPIEQHIQQHQRRVHNQDKCCQIM